MRLRALLTIPLLLALATPAGPAGAAPPAATDPPTWSETGVPYVDADAHVLRFGEGTLPVARQLTSVAASAAAAYVLQGHRLTIVPADGGPHVVVDRGVVGLPIADPVGHRGVWTTRTARGGVRLRAWDDRTATLVRGPRVGAGRVFAVDGRRVFLTDTDDNGGQQTRWTVGGRLQALPGARIVSDAAGSRRLELRRQGLVVVGRAGKVQHRIGGFLGTFDPHGRVVALSMTRQVYDLASRSVTRLAGLGADDVVSTRWTPSGDLVVAMGPLYDDYDDANPLRRYLCDVVTARCARLPGTARLGDEPTYESTAGGVFYATFDLS